MSSKFDFDVLCYGTISADNLIYVPFLPTPRRDSHVQQEHRRLGGEALTVAAALSTWGLRVAVVGNAIGDDPWGRFIVEELEKIPGIDLRYVERQPGLRTPICRVLVTPDGERSILGYWFDETPKTTLSEAMMDRARLLSVDVYGKEERDAAARIARSLGRPVVSADAIWPGYPLASLSDVTVISRDFLLRYFPGAYVYDHCLDLQAAGAGEIIVTHGQDPVLAVNRQGRPHSVETFRVQAIDTTGAGDIFKAAVIFGHLQGWEIDVKARFACAAASLYIQRPRGSDLIPELAAIRRLAQV